MRTFTCTDPAVARGHSHRARAACNSGRCHPRADRHADTDGVARELPSLEVGEKALQPTERFLLNSPFLQRNVNIVECKRARRHIELSAQIVPQGFQDRPMSLTGIA